MGGASRKYVEEKGFGNATLCTGHFVQLCVANVHICSDMCVRRCEWAEALYTCTPEFTFAQLCTIFAQFCAVFAQFCAVAEARGGMRRFYTHLQAASWRRICAIVCNSTLGGGWWRCHRAQTTRMDEAPNAAIRSRRQFAKTLEGRTICDQASEVLWVPRNRLILQVCQTKTVRADQWSAWMWKPEKNLT